MPKEKQGYTVKLKYDFPTEKDCQVQLSNGKFTRVTPRDFRSWNGKRQIIFYDQEGDQIQEYLGPVYYWNTNEICDEPKSIGVQYLSGKFESILRPGEKKQKR